jgi:hypothetical protein
MPPTAIFLSETREEYEVTGYLMNPINIYLNEKRYKIVIFKLTVIKLTVIKPTVINLTVIKLTVFKLTVIKLSTVIKLPNNERRTV